MLHDINYQALTIISSTLFEYYFITAGLTIIIMGILGLANIRSYTTGPWLRFATHIICGAASCVLCLLVIWGDGIPAYNLSQTAWPVAIMAISLFMGVSTLRRPKSISLTHHRFCGRSYKLA
jgi:hypothetical protein